MDPFNSKRNILWININQLQIDMVQSIICYNIIIYNTYIYIYHYSVWTFLCRQIFCILCPPSMPRPRQLRPERMWLSSRALKHHDASL
jgi:hypothetical protein